MFLFVSVCALLLTGCVTMDTTMHETAIPRDTSGVGIDAYCGIGSPVFNAASQVDKDDSKLGFFGWILVGSLVSSSVIGVKVDAPLGKTTDFVGRAYTTGLGYVYGGKVGFKQLLKRDIRSKEESDSGKADTYTSILPSINIGRLGYNDEPNIPRDYIGIECLWLKSWDWKEKTIITAGMHVNLDRVSLDSTKDAKGGNNFLYGGININLQGRAKKTILTNDIGINVYPSSGNKWAAFPTFSIGIGWD